ncbi:uncharacterized protein C2845_PM17G07220 [Panicum miliaceum]|uniref:Uncharacterized protein n=1 Tax=Panicum miliaceum TaxID=4540 RepID=A0A3L6Q2Y5_PANMI|nr:uncharacterized protein C2845_PM17G07220 [Panicum miliaceum]
MLSSSPGRSPTLGGGGGGYFFSTPASPIHHILFSASSSASVVTGTGGCRSTGDEKFEFGGPGGPMISADELFHNGQIWPLTLPPLLDLDPNNKEEEDDSGRGPAQGLRPHSMERVRASPRVVHIPDPWRIPAPDLDPVPGAVREEITPLVIASSRSSSSVASSAHESRWWVFIKDMLLHHNRSEPSSNSIGTPWLPPSPEPPMGHGCGRGSQGARAPPRDRTLGAPPQRVQSSVGTTRQRW